MPLEMMMSSMLTSLDSAPTATLDSYRGTPRGRSVKGVGNVTVEAVIASNRALYRVRSVIHDERNDVSPHLTLPVRESMDIGAMPCSLAVRVHAPSKESHPR
jgi:hypothetical protein